MKIFRDVFTLIGIGWTANKVANVCVKFGEMKATYRLTKKVYNGLSKDRKESE